MIDFARTTSAPARTNEARSSGAGPLSAREAAAVARYLGLVRRHVPAELVQALLFGSRARGTARPDSDLDLLLIWRELPPDREPQATIAEEIAEEVARAERVPVAPWSVSLIDLQCGLRTPMLVDALDDGVGLWPSGARVPRPPLTAPDAVRCTGALLERVAEGSDAAAAALRRGDPDAALRRARDDVVRLCTASLLLEGETRPRRADAVRRFTDEFVAPGRFAPAFAPQLSWAADSFGPAGDDESLAVGWPPGGFAAAASLIDALRRRVAAGRVRVEARLRAGGNPWSGPAYEPQGARQGPAPRPGVPAAGRPRFTLELVNR